MRNTVILDEKEQLTNIIEYIQQRLGDHYTGKAEVVEFADFGVPQRRKRLITIFSRLEHVKEYLHRDGSLIPKRTHAKNPSNGLCPWVTVRDVIGNLPKLDS